MIKLTKIDINPNSEVIQSSTVEEYRTDQERGTWGQFYQGKSPPVDYWIVGELVNKIELDMPVIIDRWNRNGVVMRGTIYTSIVKNVEKKDGVTYITTANSLYKMEKVEDDDILNYEREMLQL